MKRVLLLSLVLAAVSATSVPAVSAAVPCRDRIYNDWYPDGKIKTTYPIACYRDAIKHVRSDARTYSSLVDDIRSAMQGALARLNGHTVPAEIGKGGHAPPTPSSALHSSKSQKPPHDPSSSQPVSNTLPTSTVAIGKTDGGGGIPVPLLVLGGLALLLAAVGAAGVVARRRRL